MHIYTLSLVYGVCAICGHEEDHPLHHRSEIAAYAFGKVITFKEADSGWFPVTLNGKPMFRDGKPLRAGDIVAGEQLSFDFVSSKEK